MAAVNMGSNPKKTFWIWKVDPKYAIYQWAARGYRLSSHDTEEEALAEKRRLAEEDPDSWFSIVTFVIADKGTLLKDLVTPKEVTEEKG